VSEVRSLALLIVATPNSHLPSVLRAALFTFGATMHPQQPPWLLSTSHNNTPSSPLNQPISQMFCESPVRLWALALDLARPIYPPALCEPPAQWPCFAHKSTRISSAFSADGAPTKCSAISPSKPHLLCEIFLPECSTTDPSRCIPTTMFPCFSFHPRSSPRRSHPSLMAPILSVTFREWLIQPDSSLACFQVAGRWTPSKPTLYHHTLDAQMRTTIRSDGSRCRLGRRK
jgi:hypothetical protein